MNLDCKTNMKQVIQITHKDTGETEFYIANNDKWEKITKKDYQKIVRGEQ